MNDNILNNSLDLNIGTKTTRQPSKRMTKTLMTLHPDGRLTVSDSMTPTETAAEVLRIMKKGFLEDAQATKIRELQDRIKRLEEAGDCLLSHRNSTDYHEKVREWDKAKEAKP